MRRQRGVALLVVMLILTIMMVVAANISTRFQMQLIRTANLVMLEQGKWYAIASEALVTKVLQQDIQDSPERTHLAQYWASSQQVFPVEGGTLKGVIRDAQGCYNLNAINSGTQGADPTVLPYAADVFKHLLMNLKVEEFEALQITDALRDWVDSNDEMVSSTGAEDAWYQSLKVPYLAANAPMSDVSELRLVKGITPTIYRRLLPMVCALPTQSNAQEMQINVNTLRRSQLPLISAIFVGQMSSEDAIELLQKRPRDGWIGVDAFLSEPKVMNAMAAAGLNQTVLKKNFSVNSYYFESQLEVSMDETSLHYISLFKRTGNKVNVIRRQNGGSE